MTGTESKNLEYISGVFKGLSVERKDYLLDTARSLLKVQYGDNYPVESKIYSHGKKTEFAVLEASLACAGEKKSGVEK